MLVKTQAGERCPFPNGTVVTETPVEVSDSVFLKRRLKEVSVVQVESVSDVSHPTPKKPTRSAEKGS